MKKIVVTGVVLVAILFLLPVAGRILGEGGGPAEEPLPLPGSGQTLTVLMPDGVTVETMDVDAYLWGVVAAEMPASFEQEALKAQAVAARTYAMRKASGTVAAHPQAQVCTDYRCCQAWIERTKAEENWGGQAVAYANKITRAVSETTGEVIVYDGQLIDAVFHSSSGTATQDAAEVWGSSVAYLQSVASPEGDEVPNYHTTVQLTDEEFRTALMAAQPTADLSGDPSGWVGETTRTAGGSVHTIVLGGVTVTGAQARTIFSLRSADFTVTHDANGFTFTVTGYGHGVGMSQYGANKMAAEGSSYREILEHYYTGVTIEKR